VTEPTESRFRILLVEDNAGDVYLFRKALIEAQVAFDWTVLDDGAQALAFVRGEGAYADIPIPDLVVLDLNLPKNEGIQVLTAIRQSQRLGAVPVIVTSSSHSPRDQADTARLGIECYVRKPSDLEKFMQIGPILKEVLTRYMRET
jgi:two-component system, chemotaxis family, response regulator Rcp1